MNKKSIIGILAIIIIIVIILALIIFSPNKKENKKKIEDKIVLKEIYSINDAFIEEIEITLNEKKNIMKLTYTYDKTSNKNMTGKFNDTILYETYFVDEGLFNEQSIRESFNENNFEIITGKDNKSYLLVYSKEEYYPSVYIYNDDLELISKDSINDDYYTWGGANVNNNYDYFKTKNQYINIVTNAEGLEMYCNEYGECNNIFKVENNKLHYFALKFNGMYKTLNEYKEAHDYGIVEERVYEIDNNTLGYKVNNVYKVTEMDFLP